MAAVEVVAVEVVAVERWERMAALLAQTAGLSDAGFEFLAGHLDVLRRGEGLPPAGLA